LCSKSLTRRWLQLNRALLTPTLTPTQATTDSRRRTRETLQARKLGDSGRRRTATDRRRGVPKP
jgi:hypothetical protein